MVGATSREDTDAEKLTVLYATQLPVRDSVLGCGGALGSETSRIPSLRVAVAWSSSHHAQQLIQVLFVSPPFDK